MTHAEKQTAWAYCPNCKRDLCSNPLVACEDTDVVRYVCNCGARSTWDFDAPVPLLLLWVRPSTPRGEENDDR